MGNAVRLDRLEAIEQRIWSELGIAAQHRVGNGPAHEWRTVVLATLDGDTPDARTLILREVDARERQLVFYTDARSPKVRQIEQQPVGALMCWSRELDWQLRMQVRLAVLTSGLAVSSRWARLQSTRAAEDYLATHPPGHRLGDEDAPVPLRPEIDLGTRSHFAMITALVDEIDWLELHSDGHRRALFANGETHWVQP
jgi:hypothetical protein